MKIYFDDPEYDGQFLRTLDHGPLGARLFWRTTKRRLLLGSNGYCMRGGSGHPRSAARISEFHQRSGVGVCYLCPSLSSSRCSDESGRKSRSMISDLAPA